jgi:hypothetical protein
MKPHDMFINERLLKFAAYLGLKYEARVISWGRDALGNIAVGGSANSWHQWHRGANAIDLKPHDAKDLPSMEAEAREYDFHVKVYKTSIHIEEPW